MYKITSFIIFYHMLFCKIYILIEVTENLHSKHEIHTIFLNRIGSHISLIFIIFYDSNIFENLKLNNFSQGQHESDFIYSNYGSPLVSTYNKIVFFSKLCVYSQFYLHIRTIKLNQKKMY
jgi:hypothetical protein